MASVFKRGNVFYAKFRTPKRFLSVESRAHVVVSLKTDSHSEALQLAPVVRAELENSWAAMLGEPPSELARRYAALARVFGHEYRTAEEIAVAPTHEVVARINAIPHKAGARSPAAIALLGGVARERLCLSGLVDAYAALMDVERGPKTREQIRVWRSARQRAVRSFIASVGDLRIEDITRDHTRRWVEALRQRVHEGQPKGSSPIKADSANKEIAYLSAMVTRLLDERRLPNGFPFARLRIVERNIKKATRLPIPDALIRSIVLNPHAMAGLDPEALDALLVMVNTGARPSEVLGLLPHHIRLEDPVPHISIQEEMRQLKTAASVRDIPLVGISLQAMARRPGGFPRYRGRATAWSNRVNAYLRKAGLPAPLTAYGLRHAFADRLIDHEFSERIIADAMGHGLHRERYGQGLTLERRRDVLEKIAFLS